MLKVHTSSKYLKDREKCTKKSGWDLDKLDEIVEILASRPFTQEEAKVHHPHKLDGKNKGMWELHIFNQRHDWVLKYYIKNGTLYLERTGGHDDALKADTEVDNELIWL